MSFGQELVAHYSLQALDANGVARMTSTLRSNKVFRAYPDRWGWTSLSTGRCLPGVACWRATACACVSQ